jgi:hypothetical protein
MLPISFVLDVPDIGLVHPTAQHPSFYFLSQPTSLHVGFRPPILDLHTKTRDSPIFPLVGIPTPISQPGQSPHLAFHIDNPQVPPIVRPSTGFLQANDDLDADPLCDPPLFDHTQPYTPPPLKIFSKSASEAFLNPSQHQLNYASTNLLVRTISTTRSVLIVCFVMF